MLKNKVASIAANLGVSLGTPSEQGEVEALIKRLHPVNGGSELVRLGSQLDGGYLIPDDLVGIEGCFSPGVADRASFETDVAAKGIPCYLADASVAKAPDSEQTFDFLPKFVGVVNDEVTITMDSWVNEKKPGSADLLLQMDIEGSEWPVLLNVSDEVLKRFRIIALEVHNLDRMFDRYGFRIIAAAFARLLEHFVLVHNHPNNYGGVVKRGKLAIPRVQEMTWLRRDRVTDWSAARQFPHPLDRDNANRLPKIVLPEDWYS